jgi:hypothetical protein
MNGAHSNSRGRKYHVVAMLHGGAACGIRGACHLALYQAKYLPGAQARLAGDDPKLQRRVAGDSVRSTGHYYCHAHHRLSEEWTSILLRAARHFIAMLRWRGKISPLVGGARGRLSSIIVSSHTISSISDAGVTASISMIRNNSTVTRNPDSFAAGAAKRATYNACGRVIVSPNPSNSLIRVVIGSSLDLILLAA